MEAKDRPDFTILRQKFYTILQNYEGNQGYNTLTEAPEIENDWKLGWTNWCIHYPFNCKW